MKAAILLAVAVLGVLSLPRSPVSAVEPAAKVYELRIYTAMPGKLDNVVARFRDHTCKLFEKHGMTNVGYWTATPDDGKLYYMLAHASKAAADASWKAFLADREWPVIVKQTEANGKIVSKVDKWYLNATDYSPPVKALSGGEHVYELRTYTASPGKLDALNARFRDHTTKLFEKHGMTNVGYWNPIKGEKGADNTLVYLLADKDMDAAKKSWAEFRTDPDWVAAKKASEEKAGGSLTIMPQSDGVKSVYLKPTDFSAMK
jgi:hypothetical protein